MVHSLQKEFALRIAEGLKRRNVTSCSKWALSYRVMGKPLPGPWTFKYHPWTREMCDAKEQYIIGQKGAQLGYSEVAINKTFYNIDVEHNNVLYILPATTPDATDFSTSRFDPALETSIHLQNLFTDTSNIGHKRAGNANLFIRGSRSRSQLKSVPAAFLVLDELDEMVQDHIALVLERMSGQLEKQVLMVSTPTIDNYGINEWFSQSTQEEWHFRCPRCSRYTSFVYPECLVIPTDDWTDKKILESHLICKECKGILDQDAKPEFLSESAGAIWVPKFKDKLMRGFHVSQLYSTPIKPSDLAILALQAETNPAREQEFYNSKLGLPHSVAGARVTDTDIDACVKDFRMMETSPPASLNTMGVDVGSVLHVQINQWFRRKEGSDINTLAHGKILKVLKVRHFEDLDKIMRDFNIYFACVDANPERRKAMEFAQRFWGKVRLVFYGNNINGKTLSIHAEEEHTVTVDRTTWLDLSLGRIKQRRLDLPKDIPFEWRQHLKANTRIYKTRESDGEIIGKYEKASKDDDHYAHSNNYAEIALPFAVGLAEGKDINETIL